MKILAGELAPDEGNIDWAHNGLSLGYLSQEDRFDHSGPLLRKGLNHTGPHVGAGLCPGPCPNEQQLTWAAGPPFVFYYKG